MSSYIVLSLSAGITKTQAVLYSLLFVTAALGGWYSYRLSKTALNMASKTLSIELGRGRNRVLCVSLHPGTVDTDLSRPYHKNVPKLLTVEESVSSLLEVIDSLTVQDTGKFFAYDRQPLAY